MGDLYYVPLLWYMITVLDTEDFGLPVNNIGTREFFCDLIAYITKYGA